MRIKFEKGITPERIADYFVNFIRDNDMVIGAVNIYIQEFDENMKSVRESKGDEYLLVRPQRIAKEEYQNDTAKTRRKRMKVV